MGPHPRSPTTRAPGGTLLGHLGGDPVRVVGACGRPAPSVGPRPPPARHARIRPGPSACPMSSLLDVLDPLDVLGSRSVDRGVLDQSGLRSRSGVLSRSIDLGRSSAVARTGVRDRRTIDAQVLGPVDVGVRPRELGPSGALGRYRAVGLPEVLDLVGPRRRHGVRGPTVVPAPHRVRDVDVLHVEEQAVVDLGTGGCVSGQVLDAGGRVGLLLGVGVVGVHEPLHRLRLAAGGEQVVGIGVEEPGAPRVPPRRVELGDLQPDDRGVQLAEVAPGTRRDDEQLDAFRRDESPRFRPAGEVEGPLGAAESTLDVGHHRDVPGHAAHPPGGPEVAERLAPLARVIGDDPGRLPDDRDPRRASPRVAGVLERAVGVLVDQQAGRDQVARHRLRRVLLEPAQVPSHVGVQLLRRHRIGQCRLRDERPLGGLRNPARRPAAVRTVAAGRTATGVAIVASRAGPATNVVPAPSGTGTPVRTVPVTGTTSTVPDVVAPRTGTRATVRPIRSGTVGPGTRLPAVALPAALAPAVVPTFVPSPVVPANVFSPVVPAVIPSPVGRAIVYTRVIRRADPSRPGRPDERSLAGRPLAGCHRDRPRAGCHRADPPSRGRPDERSPAGRPGDPPRAGPPGWRSLPGRPGGCRRGGSRRGVCSPRARCPAGPRSAVAGRRPRLPHGHHARHRPDRRSARRGHLGRHRAARPRARTAGLRRSDRHGDRRPAGPDRRDGRRHDGRDIRPAHPRNRHELLRRNAPARPGHAARTPSGSSHPDARRRYRGHRRRGDRRCCPAGHRVRGRPDRRRANRAARPGPATRDVRRWRAARRTRHRLRRHGFGRSDGHRRSLGYRRRWPVRACLPRRCLQRRRGRPSPNPSGPIRPGHRRDRPYGRRGHDPRARHGTHPRHDAGVSRRLRPALSRHQNTKLHRHFRTSQARPRRRPADRGTKKGSAWTELSMRIPRIHVECRRRPTLPHPVECSTIGAGRLSYRVRNGTGRFPTAITTDNNKQQTPDRHRCAGKVRAGHHNKWWCAQGHTVDANNAL